jgi:predicted lipoprotein
MSGLVMNGLKSLALLPALTLALAMPASAAGAQQGVIKSAIENFIRPGFHHFAEETAALKDHVGALCETPSADALETSRSQFKAAVTAFSRIEFVRIGPLGVADRMERLLFWPDRKGIALKQVQQALAEKDTSAGAAETLQGKSVAMQGLGALEFLLFGTDAEQLAGADGAYRCSYASAITTLVGGLAKTMDAEWADPAGVSESLLAPKADAADYRTDQEVLEKLAATLVHGTETIRDQRLMPVLGAAGGKPKPKSALFWRSDMTVPALAANFAGLADFFTAAKFPEAIGTDNSWITNGTEFEFANAARAAKAVVDPIEKAVADERQLKALNYMVIITGSLDTLVGQNLAAALGLSVGFSALDGD